MMNLRVLLFLLISINLLTACGGGGDGAAPSPGGNGHDTGIKSADLDSAYRSYKKSSLYNIDFKKILGHLRF